MSLLDVREIGRVTDLYGAPVIVGVDHGMTTLDTPPEGVTLDGHGLDELRELLDRVAMPGQPETCPGGC